MSPRAALLLAALGAVAVAGLVLRACRERDTPAGKRADVVLAEAPAWRDTVRAQDAVIAWLTDSIARTDRERRRWRDSAQTLTDAADRGQAAVDSTVAAGVPAGVAPAGFWKEQFEAQRRIAAQLRLQVVPALEAVIAADSAGIRWRDATADTLTAQRDAARARVEVVTAALDSLRQATRPGFDVLGIRLPGWVDDAAAAVGGVGLGLAIN